MKPLIVLLSVFILGNLIRWLSKYDRITLSLTGRLAISSMLIFTGIAHFLFSTGMAAMLSDTIPYRMEIIYITGLFEILGAIGLLVKRISRLTGILLILFFLCVLPANIYTALNYIDPVTGELDGPGPAYLFFRIPLQLFFIGWIWFFAIRRKK